MEALQEQNQAKGSERLSSGLQENILMNLKTLENTLTRQKLNFVGRRVSPFRKGSSWQQSSVVVGRWCGAPRHEVGGHDARRQEEEINPETKEIHTRTTTATAEEDEGGSRQR